MAIKQLPSQFAATHGIFGGEAAGGVRQNGVFVGADEIEQIGFVCVLANIGAANGDGNDFRAADFDGFAGFVKIFVLARCDQQAGGVGFFPAW